MVVFLGESGHSESVGPPFKNHFLKNFSSPKLFLSFFWKKYIFTIVFLGESGHFELIGPPFQKPFFENIILGGYFGPLLGGP